MAFAASHWLATAPRGIGARLPELEKRPPKSHVFHYGLASFEILFGGIIGTPEFFGLADFKFGKTLGRRQACAQGSHDAVMPTQLMPSQLVPTQQSFRRRDTVQAGENFRFQVALQEHNIFIDSFNFKGTKCSTARDMLLSSRFPRAQVFASQHSIVVLSRAVLVQGRGDFSELMSESR